MSLSKTETVQITETIQPTLGGLGLFRKNQHKKTAAGSPPPNPPGGHSSTYIHNGEIINFETERSTCCGCFGK